MTGIAPECRASDESDEFVKAHKLLKDSGLLPRRCSQSIPAKSGIFDAVRPNEPRQAVVQHVTAVLEAADVRELAEHLAREPPEPIVSPADQLVAGRKVARSQPVDQALELGGEIRAHAAVPLVRLADGARLQRREDWDARLYARAGTGAKAFRGRGMAKGALTASAR